MSEPIKVGDLVVVVRGHCSDVAVGKIFNVLRLSPGMTRCIQCGRVAEVTIAVSTECGPNGVPHGSDVLNVRRIPPLDELDGVKTEEDIREPA